MSKPSILVAGAGLGAALILWTGKPEHYAPAATPAPVHTVIVHSVTHEVTRVAAAHFPLTGTEIAVIAVAAIVAALVAVLNLMPRLS